MSRQINPAGAISLPPVLNSDGLPVQLGYHPTWTFFRPPLIDEAVNYVYSTLALVPTSPTGPGDIPLQVWNIQGRPDWIGASFIMNGAGRAAGTIYGAPLTTSPALSSPLQYMFPY